MRSPAPAPTPGLHNFAPKVRAMIETAPKWARAAAMEACRTFTEATPRARVAGAVTLAVLAKAEADRTALLAALDAVLPFVCAGAADHEVAIARAALAAARGVS